MSSELKVAVYLTTIDWEAVCVCLKSHVDKGTVDGKVLWGIGAKRVTYIQSVIERQLAKCSAPPKQGVKND